MLKCNSTPHKGMIICVVLCIILSTTPVTASVQDNLNLAISKLIGQKNETTTQAAYGNASTNAKLNYLESRVRNIESTLGSMSTSSGSVPQCVESGQLHNGATFTGPGVLYMYADVDIYINIDGVTCSNDALTIHRGSYGSWSTYIIPFKNSVSVGSDASYVLYKY